MVWTGPLHPLPPRLAYMPHLKDEDVEWLNYQLRDIDNPDVRYDNKLPLPPGVSRHRPAVPPPDTGWIKTTKVRG